VISTATTLKELMKWGERLEGFDGEHAADAVTLCTGYIEGVNDSSGHFVDGIGVKNERSLFLLSMDIAWLLWLDDRFDLNPAQSQDLLDWQALARSVEVNQPTTPEAIAYSLVRECLAHEATNEAAYEFWLHSTTELFRAYHENELQSRGEKNWSYTEYLVNGEISIAAMQFLATLSLVYDLDMPERMREERFQRMIRHLCLAMRLQNDLASSAKERLENNRANAVLIVEEFMPNDTALAFVAAQEKAYERLVFEDVSRLPPQDPFARIIKVLLASTQRYYDIPRERYSERTPQKSRSR